MTGDLWAGISLRRRQSITTTTTGGKLAQIFIRAKLATRPRAVNTQFFTRNFSMRNAPNQAPEETRIRD
jgi:hypothetical protein